MMEKLEKQREYSDSSNFSGTRMNVGGTGFLQEGLELDSLQEMNTHISPPGNLENFLFLNYMWAVQKQLFPKPVGLYGLFISCLAVKLHDWALQLSKVASLLVGRCEEACKQMQLRRRRSSEVTCRARCRPAPLPWWKRLRASTSWNDKELVFRATLAEFNFYLNQFGTNS